MKVIKLPKLEQWQKDVYTAMENSNRSGEVHLVVAKRQVGKSILAECLLIKFALENAGSTSVVVEPTQAQSRRVFKQLQTFLQGSHTIASANATLLTMEFCNGSEILFKSAEQEDNLRGMTVKNGILVIDEAAYIKDEIFEILYPCTDANNAPVLLISTPLFMSGEFYNRYCDNEVHVYDWSKYDTSKFLSKEKLERYRKTVSPQKFLSEYLGQFIKEGSYLFGDLTKAIADINSITDRVPVYAGIDWANGGEGDFTVLTLLNRSGIVVGIKAFNNVAPTDQITLLCDEIKSNKTIKSVQVELNSIGTVYYDMLKKQLSGSAITIKGWNNTNESKRAIIEQLISAFQTNTITILNDAELIRELQHYAIEKTKSGKTYTYNGTNGVHDDYVISLALAYDLYKKGLDKPSVYFI